MSHRLAAAAFALGALIFSVGIFVSPLVGSAESDAQTAVELSDNESEMVQQNLEVEASVNESNGNATYTLTNTRNFDQSSTPELQTGERENVTLSGEDVEVLNSAFNDPEVVVEVTHSPTFAYSDGAKIFYDNLGFLLALTGLLFVVGGVKVGVGP